MNTKTRKPAQLPPARSSAAPAESPARLVIDSPVGPLGLEARRGRLVRVEFVDQARDAAPGKTGAPALPDASPDAAVLREAARQLTEYFAGERRGAFDLPLDGEQGTPFQREVWHALLDIPFGETTSYAAIAARVGRPKASRAVGLANGKNPLAIIVPCHRVVGAGGALTGYGGGLERKRWLLALEAGEAFAETPPSDRSATA